MMELAEMKILNLGILAEHNHPCGVCRENHSVLNLSCGVMEPCWECQKDGYMTIKLTNGSILMWLVKWAVRIQR